MCQRDVLEDTPGIKTSTVTPTPVYIYIARNEYLTVPVHPPPLLLPPQSAALNAVVADASTHVIRGTTVSVQWSRGAKDAGNGDRPRRRNSGTSNASSGNGNNSPPRGGSRSSSKMGMFPHKGGGRAGGGGGGACGVGCSHGFSPMRSRGAGGHMHATPAGAAGTGVPYGFGGGGHGEHHNHHNQPMVSRASLCSGHTIAWGQAAMLLQGFRARPLDLSIDLMVLLFGCSLRCRVFGDPSVLPQCAYYSISRGEIFLCASAAV